MKLWQQMLLYDQIPKPGEEGYTPPEPELEYYRVLLGMLLGAMAAIWAFNQIVSDVVTGHDETRAALGLSLSLGLLTGTSSRLGDILGRRYANNPLRLLYIMHQLSLVVYGLVGIAAIIALLKPFDVLNSMPAPEVGIRIVAFVLIVVGYYTSLGRFQQRWSSMKELL